MAGEAPRIKVGVLGAPVLTNDVTTWPVTGRRRQLLLCLLAAARGAPVTVDALLDALWDGQPRARHALDGQVFRLRAAFTQLGADREAVVHDARGYRLDTEAVALDLTRFETLTATGRAALTDDPATARAQLDLALALRRGPPFGALAGHQALAPYTRELEEAVLASLEDRAEARLCLGEGTELIPELEKLVEAHPLREHLWSLLMRALVQAGEPSRALAAYARAAGILRDELGTDPGPDLERLHHAVLVRDPSLVPAPPRRATRGDTDTVLTGTLPTAITRLVGRDEEVVEVAHTVRSRRLVTLLGPPGVGKSRLAIEVGHRVDRTFPDGVRLLELAGHQDPEDIGLRLAQVFDLVDHSDRPVLEIVQQQLRPRQALLVVDDCQALQDHIRAVVELLLAGCPRLHVLATSREPLNIRGETAWRVAPLPTAASNSRDPVGTSPAYELFLDRARASDPNLPTDEATTAAIVAVCRHLDGLPLALELAAAQLRTRTPQQLAEALTSDRAAPLIQDPAQPPHHRSLAIALTASIQQLGHPALCVLRRISVFRGSPTLDAVRAVCQGRELSPGDVLSGLDELVARSLVSARTRDGEKRYGQLAVIRRQARALLHDAGEAEEAVLAHRRWFLEVAEAAAHDLLVGDQMATLGRLRDDDDDLQAALSGAWRDEDHLASFRLGIALWQFWFFDSRLHTARHWLGRLLTRQDAATPILRVRTLLAAAHLTYESGNVTGAEQLLDQAEAALDGTEPPVLRAWVAVYRGFVAALQDDYQRAEQAGRDALAITNEVGPSIATFWGQYLATGGRYYRLLEEGALTDVVRNGTETTFRALLDLAEAVGERNSIGHLREGLAIAALERGDHLQATEHAHLGARALLELGNVNCCAHVLDVAAEILAQRGDHETALTVLAGTRATRQRLGNPGNPHDLRRWTRLHGRCTPHLDGTQRELCEATGAVHDPTDLVALVDTHGPGWSGSPTVDASHRSTPHKPTSGAPGSAAVARVDP
jgi:predicted ATPase/DNA-binding SARP family transcriptional activator